MNKKIESAAAAKNKIGGSCSIAAGKTYATFDKGISAHELPGKKSA